MLNWINRKMKRKGFTLIELVIVIAILGILIAIAAPRLLGFRDTAAVSADKATAETIEKAANLYVATHGEEGAKKLGATATGTGTWTVDNNDGAFIKALITTNLIDSKTEYKPQQDGKEYKITYADGEFTVKVE